MPDMVYELGMLELKQGETIDFLWSRMTILRCDLEGLGQDLIDTAPQGPLPESILQVWEVNASKDLHFANDCYRPISLYELRYPCVVSG